MSTFDDDPGLELEELLDPTRLAAAWEVARERAAEEAAGAADAAEEPDVSAPAPAPAEEPDAAALVPILPAPLPLAVAYRQLLDELDRTLAAAPGLAARAHRVLAVPLAQLAAAIDPPDRGAAEAAIDDLEDLLQAVLSDAGWPAIGEE
jgi:hypothetical protein